MNIVCVSLLPPSRGGAELSGCQLLRGLAENDVRLRALAPLPEGMSEEEGRAALVGAPVSLSYYAAPAPLQRFAEAYRFDVYQAYANDAARSSLSRMIAEDRPDLLFANHEFTGWFVPEIARRHGIPCVLRCAGGSVFDLLKRETSSNEAKNLLQELARCARLVTPARHIAEQLRQWGLASAGVIRNGIDTKQFAPRGDARVRDQLRIGADETVVMMIGQLIHRKRPWDLVAAAERTLAADRRLVFVVVGGGREEDTQAACRDKGIADRFRFTGWVENARMPDFLNAADIVVHTSAAEGLSRVYLETQACGRVLLASDIAPAREVLVDGETGMLFPVGDVEELARKILLLSQAPALRADIGRKARQAAQAYDVQVAVEQYLELFREVLERKAER